MAELDQIRSAFAKDNDLCNRVLAAAQQSRDQLQLSLDIIRYFTQSSTASERASKKRKLDATTNGTVASLDLTSLPSNLSLPDVSFTIPFRKKASLAFHASPTSPSEGGLLITTKDTSYTIPFSTIAHLFCLPVPEKTTKQHNFVLILSSPSSGESQFVFNLPETPYTGPSSAAGEHDTHVSLTGRTLNAHLAPFGRGIVLPSEDDFASAIPQAHRKGEVSFHVKAHLGSKEGYLFFLSTGVLFGFKKPVLFFPFDKVVSTSYTSVLQRTFNLVITVQKDASGSGEGGAEEAGDDTEDVEFGMLDQADFAGIDAFVKGKGLDDASLAEARKAKRVGVNDPRRKKGEDGEEGQNGVKEEEGETELEKAQREMQEAEDEEDEEEEDYDPGSEGESEGEGSESEGEGEGEGQVVDEEGGEEEEEE
ncbi:hypothetical protein KVT40_007551 [Elsinoe batatas]|uniref:Histone chaperone RTT106/FACT complex subunit SPT16-like middle domain-containing protein n=1 Tax=Elsinoe batatas TaxID=2601811 RepID=A0A8K0KV52_9PEZI|nr:hypothetical protein KVT40_007551 [Elsinoe batatas]